MPTLTYSLAPYDWAICFQHDCPLAGTCLRHAVALLAPADLKKHVTVLPTAREGDTCSLFATAEPQRIARGMKRLLIPGSHGNSSEVRHGLFNIFGSRSHYYRYRNGEYDNTPEMQERVLRLLKRHGYKGQEPFDTYTTQFYFPK